jgi:hypothetical protein
MVVKMWIDKGKANPNNNPTTSQTISQQSIHIHTQTSKKKSREGKRVKSIREKSGNNTNNKNTHSFRPGQPTIEQQQTSEGKEPKHKLSWREITSARQIRPAKCFVFLSGRKQDKKEEF